MFLDFNWFLSSDVAHGPLVVLTWVFKLTELTSNIYLALISYFNYIGVKRRIDKISAIG